MAKKEAAKTVETKTVNTGFVDNVEALEAKMKEINLRPRKCLNWKTPYEVYHSENLRYIYTGAG